MLVIGTYQALALLGHRAVHKMCAFAGRAQHMNRESILHNAAAAGLLFSRALAPLLRMALCWRTMEYQAYRDSCLFFQWER